MNRFGLFFIVCGLGVMFIVNGVAASPPSQAPTPTPQPTTRPRLATQAELDKAMIEWRNSSHADTYDDAMGANTTCARCKSPMNWDPQAPAQNQALDCAACKRVPGAPRPDLQGGIPVSVTHWRNIGCEICHQPVGNSYNTALVFWNNATKTYEPVHTSTELCAKCHEGQHGFEVVEEQHKTRVHKTMQCTDCHGAHGASTKCADCHNPHLGKGATSHGMHTQVDCTACHDAGALAIWLDTDSTSRHYQQYIPVRFAHALTSWPSHDLQTSVDCRRCHHPQGLSHVSVVPTVGCDSAACHQNGAVLTWCQIFDRNVPPANFMQSSTTMPQVTPLVPAIARAGTLSLSITSPAERETFYVSPDTLLYSTRITGWVLDNGTPPIPVQLVLEIMQGATVIGTARTQSQLDGSFFFDVEVNPQGLSGNWAVEHTTCTNCHYDSDVTLVPGLLTLRVTGTATRGRVITMQRQITVDQSGYATVPVRVARADNPTQVVPNVKVDAVTWLYLWRARSFSGVTDGNGRADVRLETLAQSPTEYGFSIKPTIVAGVLYEGIAPITITMSPKVNSVNPITLLVRSHTGHITGKISGDLKTSVNIRAIRLPDGKSFETKTNRGEFSFDDLPIARYLIVADADALAAQGLSGKSQAVDLTTAYSSTVALSLVPLQGTKIHGVVQDKEQAPIPFAWIQSEDARGFVSPVLGDFQLRVVSRESKSIIVNAPGFYSRIVPLESDAQPKQVVLARRPETQIRTWGNGAIIIPPESRVTNVNGQHALERGWIWGTNNVAQSFVLRVENTTIEILQGRFAVEHGVGQTAWVYVMQGQAQITRDGRLHIVRANEMLNLTDSTSDVVPLEALVVQSVHSANVPIDSMWEPTLEATVRNQMARTGIGIAQMITFVTYSMIVLLVILVPFGVILRRVTRRDDRNYPDGQ